MFNSSSSSRRTRLLISSSAFVLTWWSISAVRRSLADLPVLAHHDHGSGVGCLEGKHEVEQNERIRIPMIDPGGDIEQDPDRENDALDNDKGPGADRIRKAVGDALTESQAFLFDLVHIPAHHRSKDTVVLAETAAQFHHDVDGGMRMRLQEFKEVLAFQCQCRAGFPRARTRAERGSFVSIESSPKKSPGPA